jgi:phosphoserine phosphatase
MDSTLINEEVIDEIARNAGFYDKVAEITEAAMQGKLDFKASLKERVKLLKGMKKDEVESILSRLSFSPGAENLLADFRKRGLKTAVVSGGFAIILDHFKTKLFLDHAHGNMLALDPENKLTGDVLDPVVDAEHKRHLVSEMKKTYGASTLETITVGDGANDIPMMSEAGVSVSFCGKPRLNAHVNTLILHRNLEWMMEMV